MQNDGHFQCEIVRRPALDAVPASQGFDGLRAKALAEPLLINLRGVRLRVGGAGDQQLIVQCPGLVSFFLLASNQRVYPKRTHVKHHIYTILLYL